jgi:hypothetical protein
MTIIAFVLWFMLSFVVANAASQRGRRAIDWFLLSLITSPVLAALFLLLFPPLPRHEHPYQIEDRLQHKAVPIDERRQTTDDRASIATLWVIFFILIFISVLMIAKFGAPEQSRSQTGSSSMPIPRETPDETFAQFEFASLVNSAGAPHTKAA